MLRSMYSGIGGLKNFQTKLDVIGNNIANVNTFGYKKGRVTFQDLMSQQMRGASTPTANRGGTNPMQVGLGGTIATIDTIHTQGSMQTTGRDLDVAVSGDGFFVVSNGNLNSYTRAGNFYLDTNGTLVNGDGLRVMGYAATPDGMEIDYTRLTTLQIQAGSMMPPSVSTEALLKGNLNADAKVAVGDQRLISGTTLRQADINNKLRETGTIIQYNVTDELGGIHTMNVAFQKSATNEWRAYLLNNQGGEITVSELGAFGFQNGVLSDAHGIKFVGETFDDFDFSDSPIEFRVNGAVIRLNEDYGDTDNFNKDKFIADIKNQLPPGLSVDIEELIDDSGDLENVRLVFSGVRNLVIDGDGLEAIGLTSGDQQQTITFTGMNVSRLNFDQTAGGDDIPDLVFNISINGENVEIRLDEDYDNLTDLVQAIRDQIDEDLGITVSISNGRLVFSSSGGPITIGEATSGSLVDLGLSAGTFAGGNSSFEISINGENGILPNGAQGFTHTLDLTKLTQFAGSNTAGIDTVDGSMDGYLESFNIGQSGEIIGVYSNGRVQYLGQLALATFNNPGGLTKSGNNTFQASNNSGLPNIGVPGEGRGLVAGSALEMSNVDLSEEFTEMIVAQRGFQANTRIITTSDEILQELVNLKR